MSDLWRLRSMKLSNDSATFDPSDIFYALNDLHHLSTMARKYMDDMSYPDDAKEDLHMLHGVLKIITDDIALIRDAAMIFDSGPMWVQSEVAS